MLFRSASPVIKETTEQGVRLGMGAAATHVNRRAHKSGRSSRLFFRIRVENQIQPFSIPSSIEKGYWSSTRVVLDGWRL